MNDMKRTLILAILLLIPLASSGVQAQNTLIGVELECDMQTIEINVHPQQNDPVAVSCSITNTGAFKETISLDSEIDANDFSLVLSEDNFELEAGEDASFSATFSAQPRMEVTEADFDIVAQIDSFGPEPIAVPIGMLNSTDNVAGVVKSLPYSLIDLEVSDTSTRNVDSGEEITISFTIFNDGNRVDELELLTLNQGELEDSDFMFVSDSFFRTTVNPGTSSDQGSIVIKAPDDLDEEKTYKIKLRAYSKLDSSAEADEIEITIVVGSASGGSGSIGLDLESFGDDSVSTIAMGIGGLIVLILLLVLISKLTKKTGTQKIAAKEARKAAKTARRTAKKSKVTEIDDEEEYEEEDLDFEDFDDDDFDFDDL